MEYSPPPLFKQGASARVKMVVFACLSILLLLADARLHALVTVRQVVGTVLYPLQMAALAPRDGLARMAGYFSTVTTLEKQVHDLKQQQIASAQVLQQSLLDASENAHLRLLLDARGRLPVKSLMGEILYDARDGATRKVVLDRGTREGVKPGQPVIDNLGVVGQVTRVFPFTSEVTLLTDTEQAIPVQVLRTGLRSVAYGRGRSGQLDLRFTAPNVDIKVGDVLVTSGLDGIYPAGLAVAKVVLVENSGGGAFGHVVCQPLGGIERNTQLLILTSLPDLLPRPPPEELKPGKNHGGKMAPVKDAPKDAATEAAAPDAVAPASAVAIPATGPAAKPLPGPVKTAAPGAPATPANAPPTAPAKAAAPVQAAAAQSKQGTR